MPELPEVETLRRGLAPAVVGRRVAAVVVRQRQLRWPVPRRLDQEITGRAISALRRRGKYLLLETSAGTAILHLGMSGSVRLVDRARPPSSHDHVDLIFDRQLTLRLRDPRRFGCLLWTRRDPLRHRLLRDLGPEPFDPCFDGLTLAQGLVRRRIAIKQAIMNSKLVVGIGNIYANEALFVAGIRPERPAGDLSRARCDRLAAAIRGVLQAAIDQGGTTLRDFSNSDGQPGYFAVHLQVYGRGGQPCRRCAAEIRVTRQGQRATFFCPQCQH